MNFSFNMIIEAKETAPSTYTYDHEVKSSNNT